MAIYVIDIDGTLFSETNGKYEEVQPYVERIQKINKLYDEGNTIYIQTARGMSSCDNDTAYARYKYGEMTHKQLREFGVKYHKLFFGKVVATYYIDDKAINAEDFFKPQEDLIR